MHIFKRAALGAIGLFTIGVGSAALAEPMRYGDNNSTYQRDYRDNDNRGYQDRRDDRRIDDRRIDDRRIDDRRFDDRRVDYRRAEWRERMRREAWLRAHRFHDYDRYHY